MEQVINRIKNGIMDSVSYFDSYISGKRRGNHITVGEGSIKYDADLAFNMMTRQHKMFKELMELKHTVRAFNKSKSIRVLDKFCQQFTDNYAAKDKAFYPLLQHVYEKDEDKAQRIQSLRRDFWQMVEAIKLFCNDCKTVEKIGPSNVDKLMQELDDAIAAFIEYHNDEEHYLHSFYNRIPSHLAANSDKSAVKNILRHS